MATHYVAYFAEPHARYRTAVCGAHVFMSDHSVEPTCPACAAWLAADEAEAKQLQLKWDAEEAEKRAALIQRKSA